MALPAVRTIHAASREGRATLAEGNAAELRRVLSGADLGAYDERIIGWLAGWEPHVIAGVLCSLMERKAAAARDEAVELLERVHFLRSNGERPPGAPQDPEAETWQALDLAVEAFLQRTIPGT